MFVYALTVSLGGCSPSDTDVDRQCSPSVMIRNEQPFRPSNDEPMHGEPTSLSSTATGSNIAMIDMNHVWMATDWPLLAQGSDRPKSTVWSPLTATAT
jgi:hypothetical protein